MPVKAPIVRNPSVVTGIAVQAALASNDVIRNREASLHGLDRLNNVDSADQLAPGCREQCRTRIGAAMAVYGH